MNARVKATPVCCGCGEEPGTYDHDGFDLCGACLDDALDCGRHAGEIDDEARWLHERDHAASKL